MVPASITRSEKGLDLQVGQFVEQHQTPLYILSAVDPVGDSPLKAITQKRLRVALLALDFDLGDTRLDHLKDDQAPGRFLGRQSDFDQDESGLAVSAL